MLRRFSLVTVLILAAGLAACNSSQNQSAQNQPASNQPADASNGDPANGNLASADQSGYPPQQQATPDQASAPAAPADYDQDPAYYQPVQASQPPPPLPDYSQPPAPGDDYIWTPGYWSYADAGYYWVPGAWIVAPYVGALWTPPWWGFDNGAYHWHAGYWGSAHWLLRRHRLRLRIYRPWLLRRLLEQRYGLLQPSGNKRECLDCSQCLQLQCTEQ